MWNCKSQKRNIQICIFGLFKSEGKKEWERCTHSVPTSRELIRLRYLICRIKQEITWHSLANQKIPPSLSPSDTERPMTWAKPMGAMPIYILCMWVLLTYTPFSSLRHSWENGLTETILPNRTSTIKKQNISLSYWINSGQMPFSGCHSHQELTPWNHVKQQLRRRSWVFHLKADTAH